MRKKVYTNSDQALCHCNNCRHYTASTYSYNIVVPSATFTVIGTPKEFTVIAASGKSITNCFCGNCGKNEDLVLYEVAFILHPNFLRIE
jgi:hypothetical protein